MSGVRSRGGERDRDVSGRKSGGRRGHADGEGKRKRERERETPQRRRTRRDTYNKHAFNPKLFECVISPRNGHILNIHLIPNHKHR